MNVKLELNNASIYCFRVLEQFVFYGTYFIKKRSSHLSVPVVSNCYCFSCVNKSVQFTNGNEFAAGI